ncbi:allophanate hydrolase [Actinomycetospora chiangmaiensis]|uniref:allophanate hydrolase n=1 Tax=Actinomycetospora chiangmaiensis TaxID=402650 RepID=UPI00036C1053|nr:allophanate hydrolase [Actinomycetospora chiangmaiensis]
MPSTALTPGTRPADVVEAVLARIAERGDDGVWITVADRDALHARAGELEALAPGHRGPLHGVPVAVKDNIDVAGLPTTAACPAFTRRADTDAAAVRRLREAGAIVDGKTNLDQFATGLNGGRSPYGAPESVFGGDLVSGGSSSGSAVAVAAGIIPLALGTDTAGSGRVPAALNGILGLKPTRGIVGTSGVVPACRSLDCVSVFTRELDLAARALDVLVGPDPVDPWSRRYRPTPPVARPALAVPGDLDVADAFAGDRAMALAFHAAVERAGAATGAVVETPTAPLREAGDLLYGGPWAAERLAALQEFTDTHPDEVLPVIRTVIARGAEFSAVDTFRARHRLQELRAWTARLFERADLLLLPTVPTTFTRAELAAEPVARNLVLGRWTQATNLLDLAALALPAGTTPDGRPVGVTLVGPAHSDAALLAAARTLLPALLPDLRPPSTQEAP